MELECYPTVSRDVTPPEIVPGRQPRAWMDNFLARHPYRCLPLNMANTSGWEILCPVSFTAEWNGGLMQEDIKLTPDRPHPHFHHYVSSHFCHGVVTFHAGYLFRTPPGWSMMVMGTPNHVKDGIQSLAGVGNRSVRDMSLDEFLFRVRAHKDPEILSVTSRVGLACAIG